MLAATIITSIVCGFAISWLVILGRDKKIRSEAEQLGQELVQHAQEKIQMAEKEAKDGQDERAEAAWDRFENENKNLVKKNSETEARIAERKEQLDDALQAREEVLRRQTQSYNSRQDRFSKIEGRMRQTFDRAKQLHSQYQNEISKKLNLQIDSVKTQMLEDIAQEVKTQATKAALDYEEEYAVNLEREAKRILQVALSRFPRAYCAERGIGLVQFASEEVKQRTLGPERTHLNTLEKICGVDVSINDEYQSAAVLGYDPVRRELGRMVLERMVNDRKLDGSRIESLVQQCKKELFRKILNDGNRIANELRLKEVNEDIRHMMGSLRYRYSFAQNQYFHCAEVGWLCGLLAAELGEVQTDARRSGLLHDIGKAMDHAKDGGHAVIGAEFIETHGEKPHIVHAVRAHHFDETPDTNLAYLVIAADAISGARPGARRSTVDSYTQKIADLQKIGDSFDGVIGTYILSAGREVRVIVDSERIDDTKALELSKKIARKIEEECSYPGLIKLTVVRETQAIEMAR